MRSIVFASSVGTIIEWYDFLIYATAAALVFNKAFFPTIDPLAGTLAALGTYAVGFLARPLGGALFGHFGDRLGRKSMLVLTMFIMGLSTFCIGLLPNYASIGVLAPILLILLRIVQGIGLGGEWGGASLMVIEHSPPGKRGFYGSFRSDRISDRIGARNAGLCACDQTSRSRFPVLGLAHSIPCQHRSAGARHVHSVQGPGDAGLRANEGHLTRSRTTRSAKPSARTSRRS
jgi:MFS family permease